MERHVHHLLFHRRKARVVPVLYEENVPRAVGVVTAVALWAMALLAVPHHIDTLTVWTMDQYIGHSVLLWGPGQMDHSTSMSTHLEHHLRANIIKPAFDR